MRRISRLMAIGATASMLALVGACGDDEPAADAGDPANTDTTTMDPPTTSEDNDTPTGGGITTVEDIYGPACDQVPESGEGSAQGMVDDAVGTAASNNPLLTTLTEALMAANLVDTLNANDASYTVFAPANSAFESLPEGTMEQLLAEPTGTLADILKYHVVPERFDAEALAQAGEVQTVLGEMLSISGEQGSLTIDEQEQATVLCGNIPTANATVFVIDKILMPPTA